MPRAGGVGDVNVNNTNVGNDSDRQEMSPRRVPGKRRRASLYGLGIH